MDLSGEIKRKLAGPKRWMASEHSSISNRLAIAGRTDGTILTKNEEKEQNIFEFYNGLLGSSVDRDVTVDLSELDMPCIDLHTLEAPFSEEEVWQTIRSLPSDKAPGPDGFTGKFYKVCWQTIKQDIMAALSAVWSRKFANFELLNSAFVTLLPKKEDATSIKDFRPISLVHSFAKLVTKILANRLASSLDQLVTPNQSAFIKGRFILDNFMLVHHTTKFLHQQKQARILLKLDITKAFDSVSWPFYWKFCNNWVLDPYGVISLVGCYVHQPLRYCSMALLGKKSIISAA